MSEPENAPEEEPQGEDIQEEQLNKAIEELRGVLHEEGVGSFPKPSGGVANSAIIMNIPSRSRSCWAAPRCRSRI